jgi:NADPH:quinone reductase-like Zn-dependent oxidoreductase
MKAIVYHNYGSPDELNLEEVEKPVPADHEVLIKVFAASVNSWDWDLLKGEAFVIRMGGMQKPKYKILGADIAGRVESVGKQVTRFKPGDEVFGDISACHWGGFAEYVCADEKALAIKSPRMTFEQAAATPQAGLLALQGLRDVGEIKKGHKVLLNGAGGGVGTFALQYAKSIGTEVTCVDKTSKLDMLKSLGADYVIDYTKEDFTKNGKQYDLILDVVVYRPMHDYQRALAPHGRLIIVGGSIKRVLQFMLLWWPLSFFIDKKFKLLVYKPKHTDLEVMNTLFESRVIPVIDRIYALNETARAAQDLGEGRVKGKAVIKIS